ncbi:MAG: hypothetical protein NUW02_01580 [Candidatus Campbellbacteria bacterium]|nr:hypothetical protein [Candidatus Campbellbacteria bacterium]
MVSYTRAIMYGRYYLIYINTMSEKITKYLTPVVALFFATALGVTAATTIGTDIVTGGILTVTGTSTLSGNIQGLAGVEQPRALFGDTEAVLYGDGATPPSITLGGTAVSLFSPDTSSNVTVQDTSASITSGLASITVYSSDSISISTSNLQVPALITAGNDTVIDAGGDGTALSFDSSGGGPVKSNVPFAIPSAATLPACSSGIAPAGFAALMLDTTGPDLCFCNGTSWAPVDGTGTCS